MQPTDCWLRMNHFDVERMLKTAGLFRMPADVPKPRKCEKLTFKLRSECFRTVPTCDGLFLRWHADGSTDLMVVCKGGGRFWIRPLHTKDPNDMYTTWRDGNATDAAGKSIHNTDDIVGWQQVCDVDVPPCMERYIPVCWQASTEDDALRIKSFPILSRYEGSGIIFQGRHMLRHHPRLPSQAPEADEAVFLTPKKAIQHLRRSLLSDSRKLMRRGEVLYGLAEKAKKVIDRDGFRALQKVAKKAT